MLNSKEIEKTIAASKAALERAHSIHEMALRTRERVLAAGSDMVERRLERRARKWVSINK
jgi:hypothetical protein